MRGKVRSALHTIGWASLFVAAQAIEAHAATGGWTVDAPLASAGNFIKNDIGFTVGMAGLAGWGSHVLTGHDLGKLSEHAGKFIIAGGGIYGGGALLGEIGLAPAASFGHDPVGLTVSVLIATNVLLFAATFLGALKVRRYATAIALRIKQYI